MTSNVVEAIYYEQGAAIRFTGGTILRRFGISTGWVNKARGQQGYTLCKVYVCFRNKNGQMIAPRGGIDHENVDFATAASEIERANSFALSMLDQHPKLQLEVKTLSKQIAGMVVEETGQPLRKQDLEEFCVVFQTMVVKEMKRRFDSKQWRGALFHVKYPNDAMNFGTKWWNDK